MKRVKIMLTSVAILAVVGGALAFKAHQTYGGNLKCTTWEESKIGTTSCPLETYIITDVEPARSLCKTLGAPNTEECVEKSVKKFD